MGNTHGFDSDCDYLMTHMFIIYFHNSSIYIYIDILFEIDIDII